MLKVKMFKVGNSVITNQCYLVYKNDIGVLIDPAWNYDLIYGFMKKHRIVLKAVLLTHSHFDHINLAERFAAKDNIPVFMSEGEIDYYGFKMINLKTVCHLRRLTVGPLSILPIVTAGHTEGSTCYLLDNNLFSGDTVFIEGVGVCNYHNAEKLYLSVQFLKRYLSNITLFWPGHSFGESPGKDLNYLLKNNIYFQFENKHHFAAFRTRKNQPNHFGFK